jgi:hypothetical protein
MKGLRTEITDDLYIYIYILLATCLYAGFLLSLFLTLKKEATCSSETSVDSQRTILRYITEDGTLQK